MDKIIKRNIPIEVNLKARLHNHHHRILMKALHYPRHPSRVHQYRLKIRELKTTKI